MTSSIQVTLLLSIGLIFSGTVFAQSDIDELIEQANIKEGKIALKNMPGWRKPKKVIMRNIGLSEDDIKALLPGVEVIAVRNEKEAIANVKGADAIIGYCTDSLIA